MEYYRIFCFSFAVFVMTISVTYKTVAAFFYPLPYIQYSESQPYNIQTCYNARKCSNEESIVWARNTRSCSVWRNSCQLDNANCLRQSRYERTLDRVSKVECQKLCNIFCTKDIAPVCAEYNGVQKTFPNRCNLTSHKCETGKTYDYLFSGNCTVKKSLK